jgi:altronate hydrolase
MSLDMDFDCGGVVDGRQTIQEAGAALLQLMVATASGQRSKSEDNGLGDNEFLPWQLGAVM